MKFLVVLLAIISVLVMSCKKDENVVAPDAFFLKEITYVNGNTKTEQFEYSSGGLLIKHQTIINGLPEQYEDYSYSGKYINHSELYIYDYANGKYLLQCSRDYEYKNGRMTSYTEEESPSGKKTNTRFYYKEGQIDSVTFQIVDEAFNTSIEGYYLLSADTNGNIIAVKKRLLNQPDIYPVIYYQYDSKVNPLKGLVNPMDFITYFSSANLVKDQSSTYIYKYNEKDLPVSRNQRYGQAPLDTVSMMLNFVYEGL